MVPQIVCQVSCGEELDETILKPKSILVSMPELQFRTANKPVCLCLILILSNFPIYKFVSCYMNIRSHTKIIFLLSMICGLSILTVNLACFPDISPILTLTIQRYTPSKREADFDTCLERTSVPLFYPLQLYPLSCSSFSIPLLEISLGLRNVNSVSTCFLIFPTLFMETTDKPDFKLQDPTSLD